MTEADAQIKVFWRQRSRIVVKYCGNTANIYYHVTRPPPPGRVFAIAGTHGLSCAATGDIHVSVWLVRSSLARWCCG